MVRFSVAVVIVIAVVICGCVSTPQLNNPSDKSSANYISLEEIQHKYNLDRQNDAVTGRIILTGNGREVILAVGVRGVVLNDRTYMLKEAVSVKNGRVFVTSDIFDVMENKASDVAINPEERIIPKGNFKVVIDPGHGGVHDINKSKNGIYEKDVNLDVSLKLKDKLEAIGITVVMTRSTDTHLSRDVEVDLEKRVEICNRENPDLFISIHSNRAEDPNPRGFEIFVSREDSWSVTQAKLSAMTSAEISSKTGRSVGASNKKSAGQALLDEYSKRSRVMAEIIRRKFNASLDTDDRGVKEKGFYVIKWSRSPAVLVELDFLSNHKSASQLASPAHRQKLADILADGIAEFREKYKKSLALKKGE